MMFPIVCMSILSIHRNSQITRVHSPYTIGTLPNSNRLILLAELFQLGRGQLINILPDQFPFDQNLLLKRLTVPENLSGRADCDAGNRKMLDQFLLCRVQLRGDACQHPAQMPVETAQPHQNIYAVCKCTRYQDIRRNRLDKPGNRSQYQTDGCQYDHMTTDVPYSWTLQRTSLPSLHTLLAGQYTFCIKQYFNNKK